MTLLADRYHLQRVIGKGGFGQVWLARDVTLSVDRAVKVLEGSAVPAVVRERLRREAHILAQLNHPHVVRVFDVGRDFMVMELVRGASLLEVHRKCRPLSVPYVAGWMLQVLSALRATHGLGIVHRDVKPSNILVGRDGRAHLADFGIASLRTRENPPITVAGLAMGSSWYMSPEQRLDAANVGPRSDLYAVGATLFHLLTGESPVDLNLLEPEDPRLSVLPTGLGEVVYRATRPDPIDRYADASAMARVLASFADLSDAPRPHAPPPPAISVVLGTAEDGVGWVFAEVTRVAADDLRAADVAPPSRPIEVDAALLAQVPAGIGFHGAPSAPPLSPEAPGAWDRLMAWVRGDGTRPR